MWEIIDGVVGGDVPVDQRIDRAVSLFGLRPEEVDGALSYYAEFTQEIDSVIEANRSAAEAAEALWRRRQDLLGA